MGHRIVSVYVPTKEEHEAIEKAAREANKTVSQFIRFAVAEYFERNIYDLQERMLPTSTHDN